MRKMKQSWKKFLAAFLCLAMVIGYVADLSNLVTVKAETTNTNNYISMPITIRDYAADGMLFEFNQVGATETLEVAGGGAPNLSLTANTGLYGATFAEETGYRRYTYTNSDQNMYITYTLGSLTRDEARYCVIKYRTNSNASATPKIGHRTNSGSYYINFPTTGYNNTAWTTAVIDLGSGTETVNYVTIYPKIALGKYIDIAYLAFFDNVNSANAYKDNDGVVKSEATYNQGDTKGFSMLMTDGSDYINNLPKDESITIAGTTLVQNGTWGLEEDPDPIDVTLNSGAPQEVFGALIRTDLVQPELVNGKVVYTEAAVKYIAEYMKQMMPILRQNTDGSYNTYHVMGKELEELGGTDLATKIRDQVTGGLGTYADAKAKFDAGNLSEYTGITTYYDAAYFLLHNIFSDNTGYGKTVNEYKNLNLVQTTNVDGKTCYVFNSGYDDAKYDYENGVIYNTQTETITIAKTNAGKDQYIRGNKLPDARFDPLGPSGAGREFGYGVAKSGDTYGDLITNSTADWADYYDKTNYHLSLEGHAQFIYYEDSDLYFTFTGDDDVYLFINGVRVLDVGAAHSISKVKINLNDVAELCGLKDGQAYDFDFFYMERHGTAANFGIETNIKIVDPSMTTAKTGYQNGINTGYNGYVDPLVPVVYEFALQNNGDADITDLTFTDDDINVKLTQETITLNGQTEIGDLSVTVYNASGTVKETIAAGSLTETKLKELLAAGLAIGEKIVIYGFNYTIPTEKWTAGNGTFPNTVYTTAVSIGDNNSTQNLNGMASWLVQEREYKFEGYHVYEWVGKSVTLTRNELLKPLEDVGGFAPETATIVVSTATGATTGVNVNKKVVLKNDGSITYTGTETGVDTFYYKVTEGTVEAIIGVAVYSYDVADNTYVLDYGLAVELNGADFGLMVNDTVSLPDNPYATTSKVTGIDDGTVTEISGTYGTFTWADPSLKYTPTDIIDNTDSVQVNIQVLEDGATELTKFTGVAMYETVTTAPANVVYYEENHPGITYVNEGDNQWAHYETVDENGNSVAGTEQSADQESNYGSDPNYENDTVGTWSEGEIVGTTSFQLDTSDLDALQASGIESLNAYLGLDAEASNGTINVLEVKETADVMYFDFVGTGFEIISRTTDEQYAVITVRVEKTNADGSVTVVAQKPVITESKGGDLYQVPVISITGLERDNYRVVVKAAGSTATKTRVLYIDGIRIYGPLSDEDALEYYNPEEYAAEFFEIKELIGKGQMIYADASNTDNNMQIVTGKTLIENVDFVENGVFVLTLVDSVKNYMTVGPNNELYLDGVSGNGMIAFFITPDEKTPEGARTLEIGAHRKSDSIELSQGAVVMSYGSTTEDIVYATEEDVNTYTIASGTEMYYTIDINNLVQDDDGRYLVMIGVNSCDYVETLALTNIKVSGYTISFAETALTTANENGTLAEEPLVQEVASVYALRRAVVEEEVVEIPVNENLIISSAALRASAIVSGKSAILSVKTGSEADSLVVTAPDGVAVDYTRLTSKTSGDVKTFTAMWKVTGSRGDELNFTIRVYDAEGLASVNTETVTVTIK